MGRIVFNDLNKVRFSKDNTLINYNGSNQSEFKTKLADLTAIGNKLVFSGRDYSGSFTATKAAASGTTEVTLELELESPGKKYIFEGIKIETGSASNSFAQKNATIMLKNIANDKVVLRESDNAWLKTESNHELKLVSDSKFQSCEWNEAYFPEECTVLIDFI